MTELASALGATRHRRKHHSRAAWQGRLSLPPSLCERGAFLYVERIRASATRWGLHAVTKHDYIVNLPGGPECAHQLINTGAEDLVYLAISTNAIPEVCGYPDSAKTGVRTAIYGEPNSRFLIPDASKDYCGLLGIRGWSAGGADRSRCKSNLPTAAKRTLRGAARFMMRVRRGALIGDAKSAWVWIRLGFAGAHDGAPLCRLRKGGDGEASDLTAPPQRGTLAEEPADAARFVFSCRSAGAAERRACRGNSCCRLPIRHVRDRCLSA